MNNQYSLVISGKKDLVTTEFETVFPKAYNLEENREFLIDSSDGPISFSLSTNPSSAEPAYLVFTVPGSIQKTVINVFSVDYVLNSNNYSIAIPFNRFLAIDWPVPIGGTLNNLTIQTTSLEAIKIKLKVVYIDPNP